MRLTVCCGMESYFEIAPAVGLKVALRNIVDRSIKMGTIYGRKEEEEYCSKPLSYVMVRYGISVVIVLRFAKH